MINYELPKTVEVGGKQYRIKNDGDYRMILDVITAMNDTALDEREKGMCTLLIFYDDIPDDTDEAIRQLSLFIDCGEQPGNDGSGDAENKPSIMDWEHDFLLICSAINRVLNCDIRALPYLHWWTFISAYNEIPENCQFSEVLKIRSKMQKGKKLDAGELEYYRANRKMIDLPKKYTQEEEAFFRDVFGEEVTD